MKKMYSLALYISLLLLYAPLSIQAQNYQWAKSFGGQYQDLGTSMVASGGYIYMTGAFRGTVDFDPGPGKSILDAAGFTTADDIFIAKFDLNGKLIWAKRCGGNGLDWGLGIAADAAGNIYTTGYFTGTVDFDPGPATFNLTSNGNSDIFILKLNPDGNFIWAKSMGGKDLDQTFSIDVTPDGMVYTVGDFTGTADFDPGPGVFNLTAVGNEDIFVSKLDVNGNFVWAKSMGGVGYDWGYMVKADAAGDVYTTGGFAGTVDFNPDQTNTYNLTSAGGNDIFLSKLDANGNFIWAKQMGGIGDDGGQGLTIDGRGNVYSTGFYRGNADFDPGSGSFIMSSKDTINTYISKLDANGNFVWAKDYRSTSGGNGTSVGENITFDTEGNIYCIGEFSGSIDFDPNSGTHTFVVSGNNDGYITKSDSNGSLIWVKYFGGAGYDNILSIVLDGAGSFYVTGNFGAQCDFNPPAGATLQSNGDNDIYLAKYGTATGVEERTFTQHVLVAPNPTKGLITIDLGSEPLRNVEVVVTNAIGQEISRKSYESTAACTVNIDGASGVYAIKITSGSRVSVVRVVKQ